jgi:putative transposase
MAGKRLTSEEIVARLRQVDVLNSQGRTVAEAVRATGVTEVTYYRWRKEYGGFKGDCLARTQRECTVSPALKRSRRSCSSVKSFVAHRVPTCRAEAADCLTRDAWG